MIGLVFLRGTPVEEYMASAITEILKHRDKASGLEAHGTQLAGVSPPESVARFHAALKLVSASPAGQSRR